MPRGRRLRQRNAQFDHLDGGSCVHLGHGEALGMRLTPAEARRLAVELVAVADELDRSGER